MKTIIDLIAEADPSKIDWSSYPEPDGPVAYRVMGDELRLIMAIDDAEDRREKLMVTLNEVLKAHDAYHAESDLPHGGPVCRAAFELAVLLKMVGLQILMLNQELTARLVFDHPDLGKFESLLLCKNGDIVGKMEEKSGSKRQRVPVGVIEVMIGGPASQSPSGAGLSGSLFGGPRRVRES